MSDYTVEMRMTQLKAMHEVMLNANDEILYLSWVTGGVPDCPSDDDFESIAEDNDSYNETCDLFAELVKDEGYRC